jgi:DNA replication and repair protein RecF
MAMKIAELSRAESVIGFRPILLLDDILSELDPNHRDTLLATVVRGGQAFITATEESLVERNELRDLAAVRLTGVGQLEH